MAEWHVGSRQKQVQARQPCAQYGHAKEKNIQMTTAVILGGSVAGVAIAATAVKHFDKVFLVDKDDLFGSVDNEEVQETAARRRNCQQYIHPHILLGSGATAMEKLAPGILQLLSERGASTVEFVQSGHYYDFQGLYPRVPAGLLSVFASRRLLNECFQQVVLQNAGDKLLIRGNTKVSGLLWARGKSPGASATLGIRGVVLADGEEMIADAVFVADGRKSQLPHWLKEAGIKMPEPDKVDCKIKYATRWFKRPADFDPTKEFYWSIISERPAGSRTAAAVVLEKDYVQIVLADAGHHAVPGDEEGFAKFLETLPDATIYRFMKRCEPITPILRIAGANNYRAGYHKIKMDEWPRGLFVLGDAMLSFNPLYGQGMTVAAMEAVALDDVFAKALRNLSDPKARMEKVRGLGPKAQKRLLKCASVAWDVACAEDQRYEDLGLTVVKSKEMKRQPKLIRAYGDALFVAAHRNPKAHAQLWRVFHLKDRPETLFKPSMVWAVLMQAIRKKEKTGVVQMPAAVEAMHASRDDKESVKKADLGFDERLKEKETATNISW